jgi:hypothetical protein
MGQTAADKIYDNRDVAAEGLEKAAMALHENAEGLPGGEKGQRPGHVTAEKLISTAEYVREHHVKSMMTDVESPVRKNPSPGGRLPDRARFQQQRSRLKVTENPMSAEDRCFQKSCRISFATCRTSYGRKFASPEQKSVRKRERRNPPHY